MNDFHQQSPQPPGQVEGQTESLASGSRDTSPARLDQVLKDYESRYRALIDSTAAGYLVIDAHGRVIDANEAYARLTGHQAVSEILGHSILEWTAKDDVTRTVEEIRHCLAHGFTRGLEVHYADRDGHLTPLSINASIANTIDGPCIVALCRDLRVRVATDAPLPDRQQRSLDHHHALSQILTSPAFLQQNLDELFTLVTRTVAEVLRIERASIWRLNDVRTLLRCVSGFERSGPRQVAGMELEADSYRAYFRALENNEPMLVDNVDSDRRTDELSKSYLRPFGVTGIMDMPILVNSRLDGVLCLQQVGTAEPWRPGDRLFVASVANLIALAVEQRERRRAEESFKQSEERYRQLVELSPDAILVIQHDRITFANPAALSMLGAREPSQVLGEGLFHFVHPLYHDTARNRLRLSARLGATIPFVDEKYVRLDGTVLNVETTSGPYRDEQGEGIQVIVRDVSARKHTEHRLENSEQRLELAVGAAGLGFWDWNLRTGDAYFDQRWLDMLGYTREDFPQNIGGWEELVHPADMPRIIAASRAHAEGATPYYDSEHRLLNKAGERRWIHDRGKIVERDEEERPLREIGTSVDVTERKIQEEALHAGDARFARFFQSNPPPGIIGDFPEGRIIEVNEAFLRSTGCAREDVIGQPAADLVPRMDGAEELEQRVIERTAELEANNAALRAVEARQLALLDAVPDAIFRISQDGTVLDFSAPRGDPFISPERLLGYNLRDLDLEPATLIEMLATIGRALASGTIETLEYSRSTPHGARAYQARVLSSGDNEVVAMVRDITERKQIEGALRASASDLRAAQAIARLGSWEMNVVNLDDLDANPVRWSDEMFRILGYLPGEVRASGEHLLAAAHPDDRPRLRDALIAALRHGEHLDIEHRIIRPDGTERFVHMRSDVIYDDRAGGALKVLGVALDITERKLTEEALRLSEERLRRIVDAVPHLIYVKDIAGRFIVANQAVADLFGTSVDGLRGRTEAELIGVAEQVARSRETDLDVMLTGQPRLIPEETIFDVHGNEHVLETMKLPFTFSGTSLPAVLGVSTDITYRKQADDSIRELNEEPETAVLKRAAEIETATRELEGFSESVLHDLIAPLRSIDAWSLAMIEGYGDRLDERGRQTFVNVHSEAQRMNRLIGDMLELSRVTGAEMRHDPVDLTAMAEEIIAGLRRGYSDRNLAFVVEPHLTTAGDATLLGTALRHLLENACKSTGTRDNGRIEMGMSIENGEPVFFVRDNGVGFDMACADRLFVPFWRPHRATEFPGSGVGLAIVRRVVQRHGGRVWAEGVVNQGAVFKFTLPISW
ncbi:MAG: PAS domain S-box protein [Chromatiales bacterium]